MNVTRREVQQIVESVLDEEFPKQGLETIENPNFSIILPQPCLCACSFCFKNKLTKINEKTYFKGLKDILYNLPDNFNQVSITGGEPTLSPHLNKILGILKDAPKIKKVILTTNGLSNNFFNLKNFNVVTAVNISRHHYDDEINQGVFKNKDIPNTFALQEIIVECNKRGKPVMLNCVLTDNLLKNKDDIFTFLEYAKNVNASGVCFRKVQTTKSNLNPSALEKAMQNDYKVTGESRCPVCVSRYQIIEGMYINWKASFIEPSRKWDKIYELIYHSNEKLTADWSGQYLINIKDGVLTDAKIIMR
jgi:MoaA/NifB/PqqE/SkfB family radical SAM enzyme